MKYDNLTLEGLIAELSVCPNETEKNLILRELSQRMAEECVHEFQVEQDVMRPGQTQNICKHCKSVQSPIHD